MFRIFSPFRSKLSIRNVHKIHSESQITALFSTSSSSGDSSNINNNDPDIPDPPMDCCMSGCANCVWISYAEELQRLYSDGHHKARKELEERITDPSLKAFIELELQNKLKK